MRYLPGTTSRPDLVAMLPQMFWNVSTPETVVAFSTMNWPGTRTTVPSFFVTATSVDLDAAHRELGGRGARGGERQLHGERVVAVDAEDDLAASLRRREVADDEPEVRLDAQGAGRGVATRTRGAEIVGRRSAVAAAARKVTGGARDLREPPLLERAARLENRGSASSHRGASDRRRRTGRTGIGTRRAAAPRRSSASRGAATRVNAGAPAMMLFVTVGKSSPRVGVPDCLYWTMPRSTVTVGFDVMTIEQSREEPLRLVVDELEAVLAARQLLRLVDGERRGVSLLMLKPSLVAGAAGSVTSSWPGLSEPFGSTTHGLQT